MTITLKEIDQLSIVTLQDNYVDLLAQDNSPVVQRAMPLEGLEIRKSVMAEHGFSSFISTSLGAENRSMLFDFGFSEQGAAFNADALHIDLTRVEEMALSHGHLDHVGGLIPLTKMTGKASLPLVLHPSAFRHPRYMKIGEDLKLSFPSFTRDRVKEAGALLVETEQAYAMLDSTACFLGAVPRVTDFENGPPNMVYEENGSEIHDTIDEDSAMVFHVKGKGLVIVSGCAHSGIANTVYHARSVTGVNEVYAVMGGFHLSGADMDSVIKPTVSALKEIDPEFVIPIHCTGRQATQYIEKKMPDNFLLNMSGTTLTFSS